MRSWLDEDLVELLEHHLDRVLERGDVALVAGEHAHAGVERGGLARAGRPVTRIMPCGRSSMRRKSRRSRSKSRGPGCRSSSARGRRCGAPSSRRTRRQGRDAQLHLLAGGGGLEAPVLGQAALAMSSRASILMRDTMALCTTFAWCGRCAARRRCAAGSPTARAWARCGRRWRADRRRSAAGTRPRDDVLVGGSSSRRSGAGRAARGCRGPPPA